MDLPTLKQWIRTHCLVTSAQQELISPRGKPQSWLIDLRRLMLNPDALEAVTDAFWRRYQGRGPLQIGGMEVAAVPLVTALLLKAKALGIEASGFFIRKERKPTGRGQSIEGCLNDAPIVVVDDLLNSGDSLEKARVVLARAGRAIADVFVIIDYRRQGGIAWRRRHGIPVNSLFLLKDFSLPSVPQPPALKFQYQLRWRFDAPDPFPFHVVPKSTPLLVADRLYMGSDGGDMWCIDAADGAPRWRFKAKGVHRKGIWSSPAYHQGRLYFGAYNGNVYCLDADSGEAIWTNALCEWVGSSPCVVEAHNLVVIGLEYERPRQRGSVAAFDLATGRRVWERGMHAYQHGSACYCPAIDAVVVGSSDHALVAYSAATGDTLWTLATERSIKYPPCYSAEHQLIAAASFDGHIYIVDALTGTQRAAIPTDNICYTTPLMIGDRLFCGSGDRHLYVVDLKSFAVIAKRNFGARIYASPRLLNGQVVFATNGGKVIEMDPVTLQITGKLQLPDAVTNAVSASRKGDILYIATYMNELYAVERRIKG